MSKHGSKWSREETILAFELYCRTPFGKIGKTNPDIIELSSVLGRTPSAVALKMSNLASCDPILKARNISGMSHTSSLDSVVFEEFYNNLQELKVQSSLIKSEMGACESESAYIEKELEHIKPGEYKERLRKERIGQYFFRQAILNSYSGRCCITKLDNRALLVASHIKPWAVSLEKTERTNPQNGLCLNAFHDQAFDKGLITVNKNYKVIVSTQLSKSKMDDQTRDWLKYYDGKEIMLPDKFIPAKEFLEYHNDVVFIP